MVVVLRLRAEHRIESGLHVRRHEHRLVALISSSVQSPAFVPAAAWAATASGPSTRPTDLRRTRQASTRTRRRAARTPRASASRSSSRRRTLTVIKHVVNDNGGTSDGGDFTMTVDDTARTRLVPGRRVARHDGDGRRRRYTVVRDGPSGYAASYSADCSGHDRHRRRPRPARSPTTTRAEADRDQARDQRQRRHGAAAGDFTMNVADRGTNPASSRAPSRLARASRRRRAAYTASRDRHRPATRPATRPTARGTIAIGQTKTCTVTNDDIAAEADRDQARRQRQRRHGDGGDFTMTVATRAPTPASFPGAESPGTTVTLDAGRLQRHRDRPEPATPPAYSADCSGHDRRWARPRPARSPTTTSRRS